MFKDIKMISLEDWYASQCNGKWEHSYGIRLRTLDNPGWHLSICLNETGFENKKFQEISNDRTEHDWVHCRVQNSKFDAHCGPKNLEEMIEIFLTWVNS